MKKRLISIYLLLLRLVNSSFQCPRGSGSLLLRFGFLELRAIVSIMGWRPADIRHPDKFLTPVILKTSGLYHSRYCHLMCIERAY